MDSSNATSSSGAGPQPRKTSRRSLREVFESLPLAAQFRVTAIAAVTVTLLAVQVVIALVALIFTAILTAVIAFAVKPLGWRVSKEDEDTGIDETEHAETAYELV